MEIIHIENTTNKTVKIKRRKIILGKQKINCNKEELEKEN